MIHIKTVNQGLWGLNALLTLALLGFVGRSLICPPKIDHLIGLDRSAAERSRERGAAERPNEQAFLLKNPIGAGSTRRHSPTAIVLKGALPAEHRDLEAAFVALGGSETIAWKGIELEGWVLTDLWKDRASFRDPNGERVELAIGAMPPSAAVPEGTTSPRGEPYQPDLYKSRRLVHSEGQEVWAIDVREIDWAAQNLETLLDREVQFSPYAGGGLRIDRVSAESLATARGLMAGDVLREVNGRRLDSLADVRSVLARPPRTDLRLTLERAGRPVVIEYRPLPR